MAAGYKAGDKAYIVESNRIVRECTIMAQLSRQKFDIFIMN